MGSLPETILHPSRTGSETPPALQATLRVPGTHEHTSGVFWSRVLFTSQAAPLTLMNRLESLAGNCPPPVSMWCFIRKPMPRTPLTAMGIWTVSGKLDGVPPAPSSGQQGQALSLPQAFPGTLALHHQSPPHPRLSPPRLFDGSHKEALTGCGTGEQSLRH